MIARNYVKNLDAMAKQRELWSKSKRDTIMMRLAGLVMRGHPAPDWFKEARGRAKKLAEMVREACRDWITEAWETESANVTRTGFTAHVYSVNQSMRDHKRRIAAHHLAKWLGFQRVDTNAASSTRCAT